MQADAPLALRHGPLTVYLKSLDGCPDVQAFLQTLPAAMPVMWCDSARQHPITGRWSMVGADPWLTFVARGSQLELRTSSATHRWQANPLEGFRHVLRRYRVARVEGPQARAVGLMGFLSYDLNCWIERLPAPQPTEDELPAMLWCGMRRVVLLDHLTQRTWILSVADPHLPHALAHRQAREALDQTLACLTTGGAAGDANKPRDVPVSMSSLSATTTQTAFERTTAQVLEHIRAGEIFQANLSQRFSASWHGPAFPLYQALRRINPSPFASYLSWEALRVVSCSPERLVRVQEGRIDTRPIAGTRPRGTTPQDDMLHSLELLLSEKERAEHIMLVDLARNDVGRVAAPGSMTVNELMGLEAYSHVLHIVSDISARLRRGTDAVDVIRAVFPGGTITGCPKVRCMQILRALEPVARGLYTGSLGYIGFDGTMDLNIAIRTITIQGARLTFHVGAGIVADSVPEREYQETLAKAQALMNALGMVSDAPPGEAACQSVQRSEAWAPHAADGARLKTRNPRLEPNAFSLERRPIVPPTFGPQRVSAHASSR